MDLLQICDLRESDDSAIKHCEYDGSFETISYAELREACEIVVNILQDVKSSRFIGIASDVPSQCLPALMLGIMSGGCAFFSMPSLPERTGRLCEKLNVTHVFGIPSADSCAVVKTFSIHGKSIVLARTKEPLVDQQDSSSCKSLFAYATSTSGSTGMPKIVKVTHGSIVPNILDLRRILNISSKDIVAQLTARTFDPSVVEIFLAISCGATLFTVASSLKNDSELLLRNIIDGRVSVLQSTPSMLLQRWSSEKLSKTLLGNESDLRILLLGGEDFPSRNILNGIRGTANETRVFDIYGISEVSCWASIREIQRDQDYRCLGELMSETILEVRNEEGNTVKAGEGILHIGSNSRICVIDEENIADLNCPVFRNTGDIVEIDQDGRITLKGRRGRQVKRYGMKLSLKDLENHVGKLPFVENCHAIFLAANQSLHLYFTTFLKLVNGDDVKNYEKKVLLHTKELSDVYRPDEVTHLTEFKLTSNGKICEDYLKKSSLDKSSCPTKKKKPDENVIETFDKILKRYFPDGEKSRFLDSGGTSVIALQISNELEEVIGHEFPKLLVYLLGNETFAKCRAYIQEKSLVEIKGQTPKHKNHDNDDNFITKRSKVSADSGKRQNIYGKCLPLQKCRGRSNFPTSIENPKVWSSLMEIRLENRYHLGKCVDASPMIFTYPGDKNYVSVGSHDGIICTAELNKGKSAEHWEISLPDRIEASILVLHDFRGIVGSYDGFVYCLHLKTGEIFWKFKTGDIVKCTAVLCSRNENIFFGSYDRKAYCISLEDGNEVWSTQAGNGSICGTPCVDEKFDCVLFATLDGTCVSLKQNSGEINWRKKFDRPIFSAPITMSNELAVFCDVSGNLKFMSLATGKMIWSLSINGNVFSHMHVHTSPETKIQSLLFASENKNVYKVEFSSETNAPIFRLTKNIDVAISSTPWSNGRIIVVIGNDGNLKILDFINGEILHNYRFNGDVFSSPIIHDDFIVAGCRDDHLYVLSMRDAN